MLNIYSIIALIIAITIHEFSHAYVADRLGDPTPRSQDRLSLNPLRHLDPIGTLMLLFVGFGWGKPVQIDPYNFSRPRRDEILVSLAGPASNLILAAIVSLVVRYFGVYQNILFSLVAVNLALAIFNLLPLWPLDGSKILLNLLPLDKSYDLQNFLERFGVFILLAALTIPFGGSNLVSFIINPPITFLLQLLLG